MANTSGYLRCKKAFAADVDGRQVVTREGDPIPSDSDLVKRFPGFFEGLDEFAERETARRTGRGEPRPVEQATAAPGEQRTTKRKPPPHPPTEDDNAKTAGSPPPATTPSEV